MLRQPAAETVAAIAKFIDVTISDSLCEYIAQACSFKSMSKEETTNHVRLPGWPHRVLPG